MPSISISNYQKHRGQFAIVRHFGQFCKFPKFFLKSCNLLELQRKSFLHLYIQFFSFKALFHIECNLCFLFLVLFLVQDISEAAFLPDLLSHSDILIGTKKQLQ